MMSEEAAAVVNVVPLPTKKAELARRRDTTSEG